MRIDEPIHLLTHMLQVLYSAETQLILTLPRVIARCQSDPLRMSLSDHLEQTKTHASRLEQMSRVLGVACAGRRAFGMEGILKEGEETLGHGADPALTDVAIVEACQLVEHYEIALYRSMRELAASLEAADVVGLIDETLAEEEKALDNLSRALPQAIDAARAQMAG